MIDLWYKNAIIYNVDVDSFYDADGDGIGDFRGLTAKLDYLAGLNVTCLWLAPFYPSPGRDNGYDVKDYYGVDSRLGTLGDFVEFTCQARERGLRIIVDLVVNHTSIDHPWFQEARRDPASPHRDYYVWAKELPDDANTGMVFPGYQESVWTFDDEAQLWYFHRFYQHQPDLNIYNPAVRDEIAKIMGFWLQLGVSGFRVDALPFLLELRGIADAPPDQDSFQYLREMRNFLSWRRGNAIMLAEANLAPDDFPAYFDNGNKVQMMFNFYANQYLFLALARGEAEPLKAAYGSLPRIPDICQWANFLRNHDELDLGRLTDEEREDVFGQFAPDPNMRLYDRGIRRRLAPMLNNNRQRLECACSLMLSLPGTPVLRYGDEIGMGEALSLPERESVRTPMQWNDGPNGGFSTAPAEDLLLPAISGGEWGYQQVNVEAQQRDRDSLLSWTERILRVRRGRPEFGWGECEFLETRHPGVLAHRCAWKNKCVLIVHNLSDQPATVEARVPGVHHLDDLLTRQPFAAASGDCFRIELAPYGYRWFAAEA